MFKRVDLLLWLLLAFLLGRLLTMAIMPLTDTSEPRYAEIARIMAETGDWVTPWFNYGVPFWGKPPLAFWLEAASFRLFGVTEFAARLPSWLANLGILALIYQLTKTIATRRQALFAAAIFSSMMLSYMLSGAVLTDPFLTLGTTLSLVSFILALRNPGSLWGWWFFVGLAIGLLAKGPLALVLVGGPVFLWLIWCRRWRDLRVFPWFRGSVLTGLLTLPWYVAAELKTPGFIDYFIVGEHFMRFLDPGWTGDRYGSAHDYPYGTIWIFWIWATFPWGLIALALLIRHWLVGRKNRLAAAWKLDDEQRLLLLAVLFPSLFFTFSGNILWSYQLPALVPFAILLAPLVTSLNSSSKFKTSAIISTLVFVPLLMLALGIYVHFNPESVKSEKTLVAHYLKQKDQEHKDQESQPLIFIDKLQFSARYYTKGKVMQMDLSGAVSLVASEPDSSHFLVIGNEVLDQTLHSLPGQSEVIYRSMRYTLIKISATAAVEKQ